MAKTFAALLGRLIRIGNLEVETADGVRARAATASSQSSE